MTAKTALVLDSNSALLLLVLSALWGGSFFFGDIALQEVPPLTVTLHRVIWAVPIIALVMKLKGVAFPRSLRFWGASVVMGALNNAIPFALILWGQTQIESGLASILNSTTSMFAVVMAGLFLADEPFTFRKFVGVALGTAGVAFIMGPDMLGDFSLGNLAQLAILGGSLGYALAGVWAKRTMSGHPPLACAFGMLICTTMLLIPIVLLVDGVPRLTLSVPVWAALLGISALSTALAYVLYFIILTRAGAGNVLLVALLTPLFAIALGVFFLGETMAPEAWTGFAIIALGFAVMDGRLGTLLMRKLSIIAHS